MALTPKQQRFVEEYLVDLNASAAARRAGYSERTAGSIGDENLKKPEIKAALQAAQADRARQTGISAERVLTEYRDLAFGDVRDVFMNVGEGLRIRPVSEWPESLGRSISSIKIKQSLEKRRDDAGNDRFEPMEVVEFKLHSKQAALHDLAQHLGLLKELHEHTGKGGGPIEAKHDHKHTIEADLAPYAAALGKILTEDGDVSPDSDSQPVGGP